MNLNVTQLEGKKTNYIFFTSRLAQLTKYLPKR
jgi:hypothetical protein